LSNKPDEDQTKILAMLVFRASARLAPALLAALLFGALAPA
jgi:hypothetical protein